MLLGLSGRTTLWRHKARFSLGCLLCGASKTLPIVDINSIGASWNQCRGMSAYILAEGADAEREQNHLKCQLICPWAACPVPWAALLWQTLVCELCCVRTWAVPLSSPTHLTCRGFCRTETLIPGVLLGLLRTFPMLCACFSGQAVFLLPWAWLRVERTVVYLLLLF